MSISFIVNAAAKADQLDRRPQEYDHRFKLRIPDAEEILESYREALSL